MTTWNQPGRRSNARRHSRPARVSAPRVVSTWAAYQAFNDIVSKMTGDITNVTFLAAANAATAVNTGGMVPVLDLTKPYTGQGGGEPRVFNRSVAYDVIKDAKLAPVDTNV